MPLKNKILPIVGFVLHLLVGIFMILPGVMKLSGKMPPDIVARLSPGLVSNLLLIGAGELISGILLILPWTLPLGVLLASGFWGGVIATHMGGGESYVPYAVSLLVVWIGLALRRPDFFFGPPQTALKSPDIG